MKKIPFEFCMIGILLLAGIIACIISGTVVGTIACALIGAAGLFAMIRTSKAKK